MAIAEVRIVGSRISEYDLFDGNRTGAEPVVGSGQIADLPSVNRGLTDFLRLIPQAMVNGDGAISIAGIKNRYNTISFEDPGNVWDIDDEGVTSSRWQAQIGIKYLF